MEHLIGTHSRMLGYMGLRVTLAPLVFLERLQIPVQQGILATRVLLGL